MKKILLIIALLSLLSVQQANAARGYPSLYEVVENRLVSENIHAKIVFIEDGEWTAKINLDYEKYIDMMAQTLEDHKVKQWYEDPFLNFLAGLTLGILIFK